MEEGPDPTATGRSTAPRPRGALRVLQTIAVWLLIVGAFVGLGYGVWRSVSDGVVRFDETLGRIRAQDMASCGPEPVVAPGLGEPEGDRTAVVVAPKWRAQPRPHYPISDEEMVAGDVDLRCDVSPDGELANCDIVKETPEGRGFGAAALAAADRARLCPRTVDGAPTGGTVRFSIRFRPE